MKLGRCTFHDCSMQADADRISQLLLDSVRQVNIIYKDRLGCMALIGCMALVLWLLVKQLKFGKSSTGRTKPHQYARRIGCSYFSDQARHNHDVTAICKIIDHLSHSTHTEFAVTYFEYGSMCGTDTYMFKDMLCIVAHIIIYLQILHT